MKREELVLACTSDIAGKLRGKAFPAVQLEKRLQRGIGWTPTNVQITCFDTISESPFGSFGDLVLIPDADAMLRIQSDEGPPETLVLGNIHHTDGRPWEFCTRSILRAALERLHRVAGLGVRGSFEHEFQIRDQPERPGSAFSAAGFREWREFAESVVATMRANSIPPDTILREFGPGQFEVTMEPGDGISIADRAVMVREIVHSTAASLGRRVTFVPIRDPKGVGNGVHVHLSLTDGEGCSVTHDPDGRHQLSRSAAQFVAGILAHLADILAITAPSVISYLRLTPHRWSAAFNNLGLRDREAAVRICPVSDLSDLARPQQFHFEFRAADAAASPHLLLAALIHAGVQGMEDGLEVPDAPQDDLSLLSETDLAARGIARLPQSLDEALARFAASKPVGSWFSPQFQDVYVKHKLGEINQVKGMDANAQCAAYESTY